MSGGAEMTPQEIVHELDKHIVGQKNAKKSVAIALRNRWRRAQVAEPLRSAVELAKDWRSDRALRRLEAMLSVADRESSLVITGNGDVLEPEQGIVAIGSGGAYAQSAARALLENSELAPRDIVTKSLEIAGDICIYTNRNFTIEVLE